MITNVNLDPTTCKTIFDFTGNVFLDGTTATITCKVDIILNRL